MTIVSAEILSAHLQPLCSRDNHVMKYERAGSKQNTSDHASYHCAFQGCSVRYDTADGYYMLIGMPDHANRVDEPGVNTLQCPRHNQWLYRMKDIASKPGVGWACGVKGCDYRPQHM
jgi:hypothetical protein